MTSGDKSFLTRMRHKSAVLNNKVRTIVDDFSQAPGGAPCVPAQLHHRMGLHSHLIQRGGDLAEVATLRGCSLTFIFLQIFQMHCEVKGVLRLCCRKPSRSFGPYFCKAFTVRTAEDGGGIGWH